MNYYWAGYKVTHMTKGSDSLHFWYDSAGAATMVTYNNGSTSANYYYKHNLQGDIIGLMDMAGNTVVSYVYDSWGKQLSCTGSLASTLGVANPLRYRGYIFDDETGLYYLQSRYYNPEQGRFINADAQLGKVGGILTHNAFVYCLNNPITASDPDGHFFMLLTAAVGAVVGAAVGAAIAAATGGDVLAGAAIGAVAGGVIGLTCGAATALVATGSAFATTGAVVTSITTAAASTGAATTAGGTYIANKVAENGQKIANSAAQLVRYISRGERLGSIVNEMKALTYSAGNEHALVKLQTGARAIVSGRQRAVDFANMKITRLYAHTHTYFENQIGPSNADISFIRSLGQVSSYLIERGQIYKFFSK